MTNTKPNKIFMTGVTGALGKELIRKILSTTEDRLFLLVRRKNRLSHWDRMRKLMAEWGMENFLGTRVHVLDGDVTLPRLGLNDDDLAMLRREVSVFYHIAALTALNGSREDCYKINFGGTQNALEIAWDLKENGKLERFFYFSTAYVAGSLQTYTAPEDRMAENPAFANYYESSKFEAETKVREAMAKGLPVTIFRPSIVVGHSKTGEVGEFNVIYPFMKLFAHGILTTLPTHPENSFNIVPIDFIVEASLAISAQEDSIGKAFHLVSQKPPTIGMLMKLKDEHYPGVPPIKMVGPENFRKEDLKPEEQFVYAMLEPYLGYLNCHLHFDTANTEKALEGTGVEFPKTDYDFLNTLIQYAVDAGYLVVN